MEAAVVDVEYGTERRRAHRFLYAADHGINTVRIRPGHSATVVNASAAGALLETSHRLLPGAPVELRMETGRHHLSVRGRVVRCAVVHVRASVLFYRGAIVFDRHLPWFVPDNGYRIPPGQSRAERGGRAAITRTVL